MRVLIVLTETPSRREALSFARQVIERTGGEQTLLAVAPEMPILPDPGQFLSDPLSPADRDSLKVRTGGFFQQVAAEVREGDYHLAIIGADASPTEASPHPSATRAMQLARLIDIPLAIVETCPLHWERVLICTSQTDGAWPTVRVGQDLAQQFDLKSTILHVDSAPLADLATPSEAAGGIHLRHGPLIHEIQSELETGRYELAIIGLHQAQPADTGPGPTLVHPDFARQIIQLGLPVTIVVGQAAAPPVRSETAALPSHSTELGRIVRYALIELLLYAILVILYALIVLRSLREPLLSLFQSNLYLYALVSLFVIVAQGNILEALTAFLMDRLRLERFE